MAVGLIAQCYRPGERASNSRPFGSDWPQIRGEPAATSKTSGAWVEGHTATLGLIHTQRGPSITGHWGLSSDTHLWLGVQQEDVIRAQSSQQQGEDCGRNQPHPSDNTIVSLERPWRQLQLLFLHKQDSKWNTVVLSWLVRLMAAPEGQHGTKKKQPLLWTHGRSNSILDFWSVLFRKKVY